MSHNGTHYERAFEAYLHKRRIPFVAVDQSKKALLAGIKIKSFDFIVYPPRKTKILADVKGRKLSLSTFNRGRLGQSWVTADDIEGLKSWQQVFGPDHLAVFVFSYWLCGDADPAQTTKPIPPKISKPKVFSHEDRLYSFIVIELNAYRLGMKERSTSWKTVYVPARIFRHLAQPFDCFIRSR